MKKSLIALAVMAASVSAFAHGAAAGAVGANSLVSKSTAAVTATGTGSATSAAFNQGFAATSVTAAGDAGGTHTANTVQKTGTPLWGTAQRTTTETKFGEVSISGRSETANMSGVVTTVNGSAAAVGAAGGVASSHTIGAGAFHTVKNGPTGNVVGASSALTATGVVSAGNGSNLQNAGMSSGFNADASADIKTVTVQNGKTVFGAFIPTSQPAQSDVKNAFTSASGSAVGNAGFANAPVISNSGTAIGGTINKGSAAADANASVSGEVSAAIVK